MQCTAVAKATKKQCRRDAVEGATVCQVHGGTAPQVRARAAVRAEVARWVLGDPVDDPGEVLLRLVTQSRIRVDRYAVALAERCAVEGVTLEDVLVGDSYSLGDDGRPVKVGEYIRGLVRLENEERDRLSMFAAKAIAAGLEERQVRLAERQGAMLVQLLTAVSERLELSADQRALLPAAIRGVLETA